jgi:hypothetical protein
MGYGNKFGAAGLGYVLAGPAGAFVGFSLAGHAYDRGYDMSDIPYGVHVEAEHEDDEVGRRWSLRFLSELPSEAHAMLRLLNDSALRLRGHAPFVDEDGEFVASAAIRERQCTLYVPFGAAEYASPKNVSLEVSVWAAGAGKNAAPTGKAILDAALPAPRPWRVTEYLRPMSSLCARVLMEGAADGAELGAKLEHMVVRLLDTLGLEPASQPEGTLPAMVAQAHDPLSLEQAVVGTRFRFGGLGRTEVMRLLRHVTTLEDVESSAALVRQHVQLDRVFEMLDEPVGSD